MAATAARVPIPVLPSDAPALSMQTPVMMSRHASSLFTPLPPMFNTPALGMSASTPGTPSGLSTIII